jgi:hypothetical protein
MFIFSDYVLWLFVVTSWSPKWRDEGLAESGPIDFIAIKFVLIGYLPKI